MKTTVGVLRCAMSHLVALRIFLLLLLMLSTPQLLVARITQAWTDEKIFEKADLVVIATHVSTRDTDERVTLPDIKPPMQVSGVETLFETCVVLKGAKDITKFRLHHYKTDEQFTNGPLLIEIPKGKHPTYLLFLIKETDGRYAPATDQIDPAGSSVFRLLGSTERGFAASEPAVVCRQGEIRPLTERVVQPWTYQQMVDKADLVVTADWISAKDIDEHSTLQDVKPPVKVVGVTTEFETSLVLKGPKDVKRLRLNHYRLQNEDDARRDNAPDLITIPAPVHGKDGREYPGGGRFLLFLKKELDGSFTPVTGQTDPAVYSVLQLLPAFGD